MDAAQVFVSAAESLVREGTMGEISDWLKRVGEVGREQVQAWVEEGVVQGASTLQPLKDRVAGPLYDLYEKQLALEVKRGERPQHVGLILDGNRRYARRQGLRRAVEGHARGADRLHDLLDWCYEFDIAVLSIWIFSLDNFSRDEEEVEGLLQLIDERTAELLQEPLIHKRRVRLRYIGRKELLPSSLQQTLARAEERTAAYDNFVLNIAIAYGGQEEIVDAVRGALQEQTDQGASLDDAVRQLTPDRVEAHLYNSGLPQPDLIIRTSGEIRLSGFLLWQSAYAEYFFCDALWPEFRKIDFLRALRSYGRRKRRFGR